MTLAPIDALLIAVLAYAVWTDLRSRRISNRLTYPVMAGGLVVNTVAGGLTGLAGGGGGLLLGLGLLLLPCALGAMGGGDMKLLAAVGALKGPSFVLHAMVYAGIAGGVLALIYLTHDRRLTAPLIARLARLLGLGAKVDSITPTPPMGEAGPAGPAVTMPYAPAIAAGTLLALLPYLVM